MAAKRSKIKPSNAGSRSTSKSQATPTGKTERKRGSPRWPDTARSQTATPGKSKR